MLVCRRVNDSLIVVGLPGTVEPGHSVGWVGYDWP